MRKSVQPYRDFFAIAWFGVGLFTLLSLVTFNRNDLGFFNSRVEEPTNFFGAVGANWSGGLFMFLGLGAYSFPLVMWAACVATAMRLEFDYTVKSIWAGIYFVSLSCIFHLGIGKDFSPIQYGSGGLLGQLLSENILVACFGRTGSGFIMTLLFMTATVFLFGIKPMVLGRQLYQAALAWWEYRQEKELLKAGLPGAKEVERRKLEKQIRELEKQFRRQGIDIEDQQEATGTSEDYEPSNVQPIEPPKVIDTAAPRMENEESPKAAVDPIPPEPITAANADPIETEKTPVEPIKRQKVRSGETRKSRSEVPPVPHYENYKLPSLDLLADVPRGTHTAANTEELRANSDLIISTLGKFGVAAKAGDITRGATITRYEVYPAEGVRVDKIKSLHPDLMRVLRAERLNILAPIPGKDSVGIEVANENKVPVVLRDLFESDTWRQSKAKIPLAIGKDVYGKTLIADLAEMPHLLIAGTTGSGKSVCINCILLSLLYRFSPEDLRLILIDPKQVEMQVYDSIPHRVVPVVTDAKKVLKALNWVIVEMEKRYQILAKVGVRNITAFNNRPRAPKPAPQPVVQETDGAEGKPEEAAPAEELFVGTAASKIDVAIPDRLPFIVVIVDELADLMQTAPAEVEIAIARLTAKARAAGIHLIVATQTPRREVVTGVIKTNIPSRIAFQVPSALDSRVILDDSGAENLVGKGDLLYLPPGSAKLVRGQGAFVSDAEVQSITDFVAAQVPPEERDNYEPALAGKLVADEDIPEGLSDDDVEFIRKCFAVILQEKRASASLFQRRLGCGYPTAAWAMDKFTEYGVIGSQDSQNPAKPREVLCDLDNPPRWLLGA